MDLDREALLQTFSAEAAEQLDELEAALVELESSADPRGLLQRTFRLLHTLKGNAGSLGFHAVSDLGHAAEDVVEDLERGAAPVTTAVVSLLLETVDEARRLLGLAEATPVHTDVLRRLAELRKRAPEGPRSVLTSAGRAADTERVSGARTIRVAVDKLDRMADLIGEISVSRNRIARGIRAIGGPSARALDDSVQEIERLYAELEETVRRARMVPVGPWFRQYERTVRDVARAHGKQARLRIAHGEVEVDTAVVERLRDALTHLLRNCVDHGVETPEVRRARGKDPCGTVTLEAAHEGGSIALRIADDGAGMSRTQIAAEARARGLCRDPDALSEGELFNLVFEPGFSTAIQVSDLSGRGIGLDVVRRRVESLQGTIRIDSAEGRGTSFTLRLPLTLATIEGFSVGVGAARYVIPLRAVVACQALPRAAFPRGSHGVVHLRGEALPCVRLRELFALGGEPESEESVVVVAYHGGRAGLVVDALDGESRTVIKPLGRLFRRIPGITGSTILGDGTVALILDVDALLDEVIRGRREAHLAPAARALAPEPPGEMP